MSKKVSKTLFYNKNYLTLWGGKEKKTDFAIKLLVENRYNGYIVPSYIRDGLIWLNGQTRTGGQ